MDFIHKFIKIYCRLISLCGTLWGLCNFAIDYHIICLYHELGIKLWIIYIYIVYTSKRDVKITKNKYYYPLRPHLAAQILCLYTANSCIESLILEHWILHV